ncbi:Uncharacterized protein Adt_23406 [Abeliophyllum distichum]|uniref:Uncharacterized protein n=1 Tax=Abeliophyllum distichum TaxID=126358 RepID=A0ABD1SAS2_9LAMI
MVSKHTRFWEPTMETRQEATKDHLRKKEKDISDLGLAYSTLSSKIDSSYKNMKTMCCKQDRMEELMQNMNSKYESIVAMLARLNVIQNKQVEGHNTIFALEDSMLTGRFGGYNRSRGNGNDISLNHKLPKIDFPQFGGENPRDYSNADWGLLTTEVYKRFNLVAEEAVEDMLVEEENMRVMQISLDALMGSMNHKTIRILGRIKGNPISILIDSWSTHSFIDERLVKSLGYTYDHSKPLAVTVANGQKLESGSFCPPLIWQIQGMEFQYKLR